METNHSLLKQILVLAYGTVAAFLIAGLWLVLKCTVRVSHVGRPADYAHQSFIECAWHDTLLPYFVGGMPYAKPYAWMNHPAWYMKGVHLFLRWMGVGHLALGSSGNGGRAALNQLVPLLQQGASTFINPDGPYGPAHGVKNGVLELAQHTGLPVLAIRVTCSRALRIHTWDRKYFPLPGSRITFEYSAPMAVTAQSFENVREQIKRHLNG